jgi:hypothetical protein
MGFPLPGSLLSLSFPVTRTHDVFNQSIAKAHDRRQPSAPIERPPAERTAKLDGWRWDILQYRWMLKIIALRLQLSILMCSLNDDDIGYSCRTCT